MKILDRISDRALTLLTAGFFALLGLDIVVLDALPFLDEAVLATIATGLATSVLQRRRARKLARKQDEPSEG